MFYRPGKNSKKPPTRDGVGGGGQTPPFALIRRRVRLEFPAINFSLRKQSSLLSVLVFKNISPGVSDRKWQNVNSGEEREKTAVLASWAKLNFAPLIKIYHDNLNSAS